MLFLDSRPNQATAILVTDSLRLAINLLAMESKVVIVTGASSGIGKACAEILLQNGFKVCLVDLDDELGTETEIELRQKFGENKTSFIKCDITDNVLLEAAFTETISIFGGVDVVINNAGINNEAIPETVIATNLTAVIQGCYLGIKYMGTDNGGKGGVIINTASVRGLQPNLLKPSYTASKYGVVGFTRSIGAISPSLHGIRINAICPTHVDTSMFHSTRKKGIYRPDIQERCDIKVQDRDIIRVISPREVAKAMLKLIRDETVSGQCMIVGPEGALLANKMPVTYQDVLTMYTDHKM